LSGGGIREDSKRRGKNEEKKKGNPNAKEDPWWDQLRKCKRVRIKEGDGLILSGR